MRGLRRIGIVGAGLLAIVLAALLVLPPLWDWSRQRDTMEAFAAAALGRAVRIDGKISLSLLPKPMLTASGVHVLGGTDAGELQVRSLRLSVALGPLLRGRVVARELVLQQPVLRLPSPTATSAMAIPAWYAGFAGRIEDGQISIGDIRLQGIHANLATSDDGVLTVSARVVIGRYPSQLAMRIGQPARDGTAITDLTLTGLDRAQGNALALSGALGGPAGLVGRLVVHGPDLSLWLPSPAVAFRVDGDLRASAQGWAWRDLTLDIGGSPARGGLDMDLLPIPRLRAGISATRIDLDGWASAMRGRSGAALPIILDIGAEAGTLGGGTLRQLRARLTFSDDVVHLTDGSALLPGDASLQLSGQTRTDASGHVFDGRIGIDVPDPRASLRWLAGAWGGVSPTLPVDVLRHLSLSADMVLGADHISLTGLTGRIDQTNVQGQLTMRGGQQPAAQMVVAVDQLMLDPFFRAGAPRWLGLHKSLPGATIDLELRANNVVVAGHKIDDFVLDAATEHDRIVLRRLVGMVGAARVVASGAINANAGITDGKLEISASNAASLADWVPAAWMIKPEFWDGGLLLRADAAGSTGALNLQLSLELGDGRLEAHPVIDFVSGRAVGRMSLRHPNARRLLTDLGWLHRSELPAWPGAGSLALQSQFNLHEDQASFDHFELTAGGLRASGSLGVLRQDGLARLGGRLVAETLPLPWPWAGIEEPLPEHLLRGWIGSVQVQADEVLLDGGPVLDKLSCVVDQQQPGRIQLLGCVARVADGDIRLDARLDSNAFPPVLAVDAEVTGAQVASFLGLVAPRTDGGIDLRADRVDLGLSLQAAGHSPAAMLSHLQGPVRLTAHDGAWRGFGLATVRSVLMETSRQSIAATGVAMREALSGGETAFRHLDVEAEIRAGMIRLREAISSGPDGDVRLSGQLELDGGGMDVRFVLLPTRTAPDAVVPPTSVLHLSGPVHMPRRVIDIADALRWLAVQ